MSDEKPKRVYIHQLAEKILGSNLARGELRRLTGIDSRVIGDWVRQDAKARKLAYLEAEKEDALAQALDGQASWEEWRDRRPFLKPNSLDRRDSAKAFLAKVRHEREPAADDGQAKAADDRPLVWLRPEATFAPKREFIAAALRLIEPEGRNRPELKEGAPIAIDIHVNAQPRDDDEDDDIEVGVTKVNISVTVLDGNYGRFGGNVKEHCIERVVLQRVGTPDSLHAILSSLDKTLLRLNGIDAPPIPFGEYLASRIGDGFEITVHVPAERIVTRSRNAPAEADAPATVSMTRQKLRALFKRWNLKIPAEAVDVEMFRQTWRVERHED